MRWLDGITDSMDMGLCGLRVGDGQGAWCTVVYGVAKSRTRLSDSTELKSCELCFIWGKMSAAAQETAPQIVLRNCSKGAGPKSVYIQFW